MAFISSIPCLTINAGKSSRVEIEVTNETKHDIVLKNRSVLGRLQLVQSVTTVEVKLKNKSESEMSIPKAAIANIHPAKK